MTDQHYMSAPAQPVKISGPFSQAKINECTQHPKLQTRDLQPGPWASPEPPDRSSPRSGVPSHMWHKPVLRSAETRFQLHCYKIRSPRRVTYMQLVGSNLHFVSVSMTISKSYIVRVHETNINLAPVWQLQPLPGERLVFLWYRDFFFMLSKHSGLRWSK